MFDNLQSTISPLKQDGGLISPIDSGHPMAAHRNQQIEMLTSESSSTAPSLNNWQRDRRLRHGGQQRCQEEQQKRGVAFAGHSPPLPPYGNFPMGRLEDGGTGNFSNHFQGQSQHSYYCDQRAAQLQQSLKDQRRTSNSCNSSQQQGVVPLNPDNGGNTNSIESLQRGGHWNCSYGDPTQRVIEHPASEKAADIMVVDCGNGLGCDTDLRSRVATMAAAHVNTPKALSGGHPTANQQHDYSISKAADVRGSRQNTVLASSFRLAHSPHGLQLHTSAERCEPLATAVQTTIASVPTTCKTSLQPISEDGSPCCYPHLDSWNPLSLEANYALRGPNSASGSHHDQYQQLARPMARSDIVMSKNQQHTSSEALYPGANDVFPSFPCSETMTAELNNKGGSNPKWQRQMIANETGTYRPKLPNNFQRVFGQGSPKSMPRESARPLDNDRGVACISDGSRTSSARNGGMGFSLDADTNSNRFGVNPLDLGQRRGESWNYSGRMGASNFNRLPSRQSSSKKAPTPNDYLFSEQQGVFHGDPQHHQRHEQQKNNGMGGPTLSQNMSMEELARFRTQICPRKAYDDSCALDEHCPYSHCLSWHRRDPFVSGYRPSLCPNVIFCVGPNRKMRVKNFCKRGRQCLHSHTKEEQMYHPKVYKTQLCRDWPYCFKHFCPFAHGAAELRDIDVVQFNVAEGPEKLEPGVEQQRSLAVDSTVGGGRGRYPGYPCNSRASSDYRSRQQFPLPPTMKVRYNAMNEEADLLRQPGSQATTTAAASSRMTSARTTSSSATTSNDYVANVVTGTGGTVGGSVVNGNDGHLWRGGPHEERDHQSSPRDEIAFDGQCISESKHLVRDISRDGTSASACCLQPVLGAGHGDPKLFNLQNTSGNTSGHTQNAPQVRSVSHDSDKYSDTTEKKHRSINSDGETDGNDHSDDNSNGSSSNLIFHRNLYNQEKTVTHGLTCDKDQRVATINKLALLERSSAIGRRPSSASGTAGLVPGIGPIDGDHMMTMENASRFEISCDVLPSARGLPRIIDEVQACGSRRQEPQDVCPNDNTEASKDTSDDMKLLGQSTCLGGYDYAQGMSNRGENFAHHPTISNQTGEGSNNVICGDLVEADANKSLVQSDASLSNPESSAPRQRPDPGSPDGLRLNYDSFLGSETGSTTEGVSLAFQLLQSYSRQHGNNMKRNLSEIPEQTQQIEGMRLVKWATELSGQPVMDDIRGLTLARANPSVSSIPSTVSASLSFSAPVNDLNTLELDRILHSVDGWSATKGNFDKSPIDERRNSVNTTTAAAPSVRSMEANPFSEDSISSSESNSTPACSLGGVNDNAMSHNINSLRRKSNVGSGPVSSLINAKLEDNEATGRDLQIPVGATSMKRPGEDNFWPGMGARSTDLPPMSSTRTDLAVASVTAVEALCSRLATDPPQGDDIGRMGCCVNNVQQKGEPDVDSQSGAQSVTCQAGSNSGAHTSPRSSVWCSSFPPFLNLEQHTNSLGRCYMVSPRRTQSCHTTKAATEKIAMGVNVGPMEGFHRNVAPATYDCAISRNRTSSVFDTRHAMLFPWCVSESNPRWMGNNGEDTAGLVSSGMVGGPEAHRVSNHREQSTGDALVETTTSSVPDHAVTNRGSQATSPNEKAREQQLLTMLIGLLSSNGDPPPAVVEPNNQQGGTIGPSGASVDSADAVGNTGGKKTREDSSETESPAQQSSRNAGKKSSFNIITNPEGGNKDTGANREQPEAKTAQNVVQPTAGNPVVGSLLYSVREKGCINSQAICGNGSWSLPETPSTASSSRSLVPMMLQSRKDVMDEACVASSNGCLYLGSGNNATVANNNGGNSRSNNNNNNHIMTAMLELLGGGTNSVDSHAPATRAAGSSRNGGPSSGAAESVEDDFISKPAGLVVGNGCYASSAGSVFAPSLPIVGGVFSSDSNSLTGSRLGVPVTQQRPVSRVASDMSLLTCASGSDMESGSDLLGRYSQEDDFACGKMNSSTVAKGRNISQGELAAAIDSYLRAHYRDDGMATPVRTMMNSVPSYVDTLEESGAIPEADCGHSIGASMTLEKLDNSFDYRASSSYRGFPADHSNDKWTGKSSSPSPRSGTVTTPRRRAAAVHGKPIQDGTSWYPYSSHIDRDNRDPIVPIGL